MGNDLSMINKIKKKLGEAYHMKDLEAAQSYLGIRITKDCTHQCIWIDQEAYIDSALSWFCLMDANNTKTPLLAGVHLTKSETPSSTDLRTKYQQLIGTVLSNQQVRSADYLRMQSVTACNITCIRGN